MRQAEEDRQLALWQTFGKGLELIPVAAIENITTSCYEAILSRSVSSALLLNRKIRSLNPTDRFKLEIDEPVYEFTLSKS